MSNMNKLLILQEKHGDWHFHITSELQLHDVCVKILSKRLDQQWYNHGDEIDIEATLGMTKEQINNMPDNQAKNMLLNEYDNFARQNRETRYNQTFIQHIKNLAEMVVNEDSDVVKKRDAWKLLYSRSSFEVELTDFADIKQYIA